MVPKKKAKKERRDTSADQAPPLRSQMTIKGKDLMAKLKVSLLGGGAGTPNQPAPKTLPPQPDGSRRRASIFSSEEYTNEEERIR